MKTPIWKASAGVLTLLLILVAGGCKWDTSYDTSAYPNIQLEESVHLTDDDASPYLDLSIDYAYLDEENDSVAMLINRAIQREMLGDDYAALTPQAAVDSFKNTRIREYRHEVGEMYRMDIAKNGTETDVPQWYNQTYSMTTFVEEGRDGNVLNVSANHFADTGGAHPHQWSQWTNFDLLTGRQLKRADVFLTSASEDITRLLLAKLIRRKAGEHPDETISTLADLQRIGYLQLTDMYIPDNFLLTRDKVLFLFNRYDIAPYSEGETVLEVTYKEIGQWMKN